MDTTAYKKSHRPNTMNEESSGKPHQGIYIPKHPEKVVGGEIITRSGWEMSFARWCDDNPAVIEWGCETAQIQYRNPGAVNFDTCREYNISPADPSSWPIHNYYPDFYVKIKAEEDGVTTIKRMLIEIKPKYQTERPIPPAPTAKLKIQKRFNESVRTFLTNDAKWKAAIVFCQENGMEFKVFTEVTLQKMGII